MLGRGAPFSHADRGLMSISMRLYPAPDPDLYAFAGAPKTLQMWLRYPHSIPEVSLGDAWEDLDAILAAFPGAPSPSPLTPNGADLKYPEGADRGAHAISSTTTQRLLRSIEQVERPQVEAYVRQRLATTATPTTPSPELSAWLVLAETEALLADLARLREICTLALGKGYGLVMALWEDT